MGPSERGTANSPVMIVFFLFWNHSSDTNLPTLFRAITVLAATPEALCRGSQTRWQIGR
jgi:hypothetical protein